MPLVHKPSFAKDMVDRRDRGDEVFRGMLFSLSESGSSLYVCFAGKERRAEEETPPGTSRSCDLTGTEEQDDHSFHSTGIGEVAITLSSGE
jgi:hypothetical protein